MRMKRVAASVLALAVFRCAPLLAGEAVTDGFDVGPPLDPALWSNEDGLTVQDVGGNAWLVLEESHALGRADLVLPTSPAWKKMTVTARNLDLSSGDWHLRSFALRITRAGATVVGSLRVYKETRASSALKIEMSIAPLGQPPSWENVAAVAIDGTEDLVLKIDNTEATVSFGGVLHTTPVPVASGDVTLCRVELSGNSYVGARPSLDEISAEKN